MSKVYKYGDHIDTDVIIPARYLNVSDEQTLAKYCMADIDASFVETVGKGDIMVAGVNFGCGSSREHAPIAIKTSGIQCVIAKSFARIFFRNAFNIGLPLIESEEIVDGCEVGDTLEINYQKGEVINCRSNVHYKIQALPEFMQKIVSSGGLVEYTKGGKND